MIAKQEVLLIKITRDPQDPGLCRVDRPFVAKRGSIVTFDFDEPGAVIRFDGDSPFDQAVFQPGRKQVRPDARIGLFGYRVQWGGKSSGEGKGTGEVEGG